MKWLSWHITKEGLPLYHYEKLGEKDISQWEEKRGRASAAIQVDLLRRCADDGGCDEYYTKLPEQKATFSPSTKNKIDKFSQVLMIQGRKARWFKKGVTYDSKGDGNCLFNSISNTTFGDQNRKHVFAIKLRLVCYLAYHGNKLQQKAQGNKTDVGIMTDSEQALVIWDTVCDGMWHGVSAIACASYALNITTKVLYPRYDNGEVTGYKYFNAVYNQQDDTRMTITIMWTQTDKKLPTQVNYGRGPNLVDDEMWKANHFVGVVPFTSLLWTDDAKHEWFFNNVNPQYGWAYAVNKGRFNALWFAREEANKKVDVIHIVSSSEEDSDGDSTVKDTPAVRKYIDDDEVYLHALDLNREVGLPGISKMKTGKGFASSFASPAGTLDGPDEEGEEPEEDEDEVDIRPVDLLFEFPYHGSESPSNLDEKGDVQEQDEGVAVDEGGEGDRVDLADLDLNDPSNYSLGFNDTVELGKRAAKMAGIMPHVGELSATAVVKVLLNTPNTHKVTCIPPAFLSNVYFVSTDSAVQRKRDLDMKASEKQVIKKRAELERQSGETTSDEAALAMVTELMSKKKYPRMDSYGGCWDSSGTTYFTVWQEGEGEEFLELQEERDKAKLAVGIEEKKAKLRTIYENSTGYIKLKRSANMNKGAAGPRKQGVGLLYRYIWEVTHATGNHAGLVRNDIVVHYKGELTEDMITKFIKAKKTPGPSTKDGKPAPEGKRRKAEMETEDMREHLSTHPTKSGAYKASVEMHGTEGADSRQAMHTLASRDKKRGMAASGEVRKPFDNIEEDIKNALGYVRISGKYKHCHSFYLTNDDPYPMIILYSKKQMLNVARLCSLEYEGAGVLAIDKTFNVGPMFVTTCAFQHTLLIRKSRNQHPVFLCAAMIHRTSTTNVYTHFLTVLRRELDQHHPACKITAMLEAGSDLPEDSQEVKAIGGEHMKRHNIVFGSDDEKAIRRALTDTNPGGVTMLCVMHLKKSLERYLVKCSGSLGLTQEQKRHIVHSVFGKEGERDPLSLLLAADAQEFDVRARRILDGLDDEEKWRGTDQIRYMAAMISAIKKNVFLPALNHLGEGYINWTSNLVESLNNSIKIILLRQPLQSLTDMIVLMNNFLQHYDSEETRAIHSQGDYRLVDELQKKMGCSDTDWTMAKPEFRSLQVKKYYRYRFPLQELSVTHEEQQGQPELPMPEHPPFRLPEAIKRTAKKPGMRGRPSAHRTISRGRRGRGSRGGVTRGAFSKGSSKEIEPAETGIGSLVHIPPREDTIPAPPHMPEEHRALVDDDQDLVVEADDAQNPENAEQEEREMAGGREPEPREREVMEDSHVLFPTPPSSSPEQDSLVDPPSSPVQDSLVDVNTFVAEELRRVEEMPEEEGMDELATVESWNESPTLTHLLDAHVIASNSVCVSTKRVTML